MSLSEAERRLLLGLARDAIVAHLRGLEGPRLAAPTEALQRPAGAFVTLRERAGGELRGCVGYVEPRWPLARSVAEAAIAAATRDGRFAAVRLEDLPLLALDVSVLGPATPVEPGAVEVGRHGLVVERGSRRGLLLPQVPVEQGWDRVTFLSQACRKAGLPPDAWKEPATRLLAFEAEVFGDGDG